jgi:aldehyde:ferredoxin oxidoreductase
LTAPDFYNVIGSNHYKNCQENILPPEAISKLNGEAYFKSLYQRAVSCSPGCATACSSEHIVTGNETPEAGKWTGEHGDKPEYLTVASFGMGCDVRDITSVAHWHKKCGDLALDILEIGNACSFIMELREKGILSEDDVSQWIGEKVSATWGDSDFIEKAIESVAYQKNQFGQLFKDGVYPAARRIENMKGAPVLQYLVYGKGGSIINEEVRPFPIWAINMAVASRGCCHLKGLSWLDKSERKDISMAWFGKPDAGEGYTPGLKGAGAARSENYITALNLLGICVFTGFFDPVILDLDVFAQAYSAASGFALTGDELYQAGERAYNLEKAFNSRLGLRREHDMLCERWMKEPTPQGPGKGMKVEDYLDQVLDEYYDYHGWDKKSGLQKKQKLEELGLEEIIPVLASEGAVVS